MRFTQEEKYEIIRLVDGSDLSANRTLQELGIHKRTFYNWYRRYLEGGFDGLATKAKGRQYPHQDTACTSYRRFSYECLIPLKYGWRSDQSYLQD